MPLASAHSARNEPEPSAVPCEPPYRPGSLNKNLAPPSGEQVKLGELLAIFFSHRNLTLRSVK